MGCKIEISDLKVDGDAEILNGMRMDAYDGVDMDITVKNLDVNGRLDLLNDYEIKSVITELQKQVFSMNPNTEEYNIIQEILKVKRWNKEKFIKYVRKHLVDFSEGVLASIIAGVLMK